QRDRLAEGALGQQVVDLGDGDDGGHSTIVRPRE
ncbi:MAG: hypothetical protein RLZZ246_1327, partial [Planctomycetota bacterium]